MTLNNFRETVKSHKLVAIIISVCLLSAFPLVAIFWCIVYGDKLSKRGWYCVCGVAATFFFGLFLWLPTVESPYESPYEKIDRYADILAKNSYKADNSSAVLCKDYKIEKLYRDSLNQVLSTLSDEQMLEIWDSHLNSPDDIRKYSFCGNVKSPNTDRLINFIEKHNGVESNNRGVIITACKQYIKDALRAEHLDESSLDCSVNDIRRQRLWDSDVTVIMDVKYDNVFGGRVYNEIRFLVSRKGEIHKCLVM